MAARLRLLSGASGCDYGAWIGGQTERLRRCTAALSNRCRPLASVKITVERPVARDRRRDHRGARGRPRHLLFAFDTEPPRRGSRSCRGSGTRRSCACCPDAPGPDRGAGALTHWQNTARYVVDVEGVIARAGAARSLCRSAARGGRGRRRPRRPFRCARALGDLREKMIAASRVGDRRWTLKLASGLEIMLPETGSPRRLPR